MESKKMKTNLEQKKELVVKAMNHYIESTKTLSNSISGIQNDELQEQLSNTVKAVTSLISAYTEHRTAMFEAHGWEVYKD